MKNPLLDYTFLRKLDANRNRVTYARITSLTLEGLPVERIEGVFTGGSITIDGSSAVRRICNLTMTTKNLNMNNIYWGLTTRVKIELGLKNDIIDPDFPEYQTEYPDIIWFPQGVYIITDFKTSNQVNNYTITLQGKDKMCLLNGDVGGNFNAETDCGTIDWQEPDAEDGTPGIWHLKQKLTIPQIIYNLVREYAQEPEDNIIIKDIEKGLEILRNNSLYNMYVVERIDTHEYIDFLYKNIIDTTTTYGVEAVDGSISTVGGEVVDYSPKYTYRLGQELIEKSESTDETAENNIIADGSIVDFEILENTNFIFKNTTEEDDNGLIKVNPYTIADKIYYYDTEQAGNIIECVVIKIEPKEDVGYRMMDLIYPEELIAAPNETVISIFDKIIKTFGVYEYFYNLDGQFVFQAKETYVNTAWNAIIKRDDETYIDPSQVSSYVQYNFEGSHLTTAYQNSPKMGDIKNDYTVWGKKKNVMNNDIPIHMRYAIDLKPKFYKNFEGQVYMTSEFYNEFVAIAAESQADYRKHPLPAVLQNDDPLSWWHIEDWYNYYEQITGELPTEPMMEYQATDALGFKGRLYFPDNNGVIQLICAVENAPSDESEREENITYIGQSPVFIFDMQNGFPVGWSERTDQSYWYGAAFMHRFNGCGHRLSWFIEHAQKQGYDSYCYQPYIPSGKTTEDTEFVNPFTVKQVDWREIIYQMAKDYYAHHLEDDFHLKVRRNNYIKYKNLNLYPTGRTGYEQYYHDIEAFWRTLYFPEYEDDNDNRIFNDNFTINFDINSRDEYYNQTNIHTIKTDDVNLQKKYLYWNKKVVVDPSALYFWFDFFNAEALGLGPFSVPAIGTRPKVVNNDKIKTIIYKGIPNIIFSATEDETKEVKANFPGYEYFEIADLVDGSKTVAVVQSSVDKLTGNNLQTKTEYTFTLLNRSSRTLTAQEEIDNLLYNYSYCNETVTINTVPIYYLEPNTIISAKDEQRVVNGYYIMNKITVPLTYNGTSSITAIKVPERIY